MQQCSVVTGIGGQDSSLLAEQLIEKGQKVYGVVRRRSDSPNLGCAAGLEGNPSLEVVEGDITDLSFLTRLCKTVRPDFYYNAAAMSHVGTSFEEPIHTAQVTGIGVLNGLEAIRLSGIHTRFLQFSTSEAFGGVTNLACNEESKFHPRSPYACAKLYGYWITRTYRDAWKMFAANSISFNHEEQGRRGPNFVTRKITLAIANIKAGKQDKLYLGNLDAKRDWSWASDVVRGMQLILEASRPDDYVLGSGKTHSVREFCKLAFEHAGLGDYQNYVEIDPRFFRPCEVDVLLADYSKAKRELGWEPTVTFEELVHKMVDHDLKLIENK
jgi:GDPmannose 4,6-dehydratase